MTHKEIMENLLNGEILIATYSVGKFLYKIEDELLEKRAKGENVWVVSEDGQLFTKNADDIKIYKPKKVKKEKTLYIFDNCFDLIKNYGAIDLHGLNIEKQSGRLNKVTISWEEEEEI